MVRKHCRTTGILHFIALHGCVFYKLEARPSTNEKFRTLNIAILAVLWRSGAEPIVSPRYACKMPIEIDPKAEGGRGIIVQIKGQALGLEHTVFKWELLLSS